MSLGGEENLLAFRDKIFSQWQWICQRKYVQAIREEIRMKLSCWDQTIKAWKCEAICLLYEPYPESAAISLSLSKPWIFLNSFSVSIVLDRKMEFTHNPDIASILPAAFYLCKRACHLFCTLWKTTISLVPPYKLSEHRTILGGMWQFCVRKHGVLYKMWKEGNDDEWSWASASR